jgi:glutamate N-acetyltransferase/amino-acid N-acetyltransferase
MANGKAGNYKISCEDTEFSKFTYALRQVLHEICRRIVMDCDERGRVLVCKVTGAKSQRVARAAAKNLASSLNVRRTALKAEVDLEGILYAVNAAADDTDYKNTQISLAGETETYVLYEEGQALLIDKEKMQGLQTSAQVVLHVALNDGNYAATAMGCIQPKKFQN